MIPATKTMVSFSVLGLVGKTSPQEAPPRSYTNSETQKEATFAMRGQCMSSILCQKVEFGFGVCP